jgi:Protein of unknown function (DUF2934)
MTAKKPRTKQTPVSANEDGSNSTSRKKSIKTSSRSKISPMPVTANHLPTDDEIARKAYALWEDRGRPSGSPDEDWFRAKDELKMKATA